MTEFQKNEEKVNIALSELEQSLDWFEDDALFVLLTEFRRKLMTVIQGSQR